VLKSIAEDTVRRFNCVLYYLKYLLLCINRQKSSYNNIVGRFKVILEIDRYIVYTNIRWLIEVTKPTKIVLIEVTKPTKIVLIDGLTYLSQLICYVEVK